MTRKQIIHQEHFSWDNISGTPVGNIFLSIFKNIHTKRSIGKYVLSCCFQCRKQNQPYFKGYRPSGNSKFEILAIGFKPKLTWSQVTVTHPATKDAGNKIPGQGSQIVHGPTLVTQQSGGSADHVPLASRPNLLGLLWAITTKEGFQRLKLL